MIAKTEALLSELDKRFSGVCPESECPWIREVAACPSCKHNDGREEREETLRAIDDWLCRHDR